MNNPGLVSIVIPCFNQAHFLKEAIESVIRQTYRSFEIIVVNDGSTDETSQVAKSFESVILIEQNNQGLSTSRNNGLKKCNGEFLVFLDADDVILPNALEIGVEALKEHPNCVFVSGLCQLVDETGKPRWTIQPTAYSDDYYESLLRSNFIWSPSNVMYRSELFRRISAFNDKLNPVADYELYLRITREFAVFHHSQIVTNYRQHQSSMSQNYKMMLDSVLKVYEKQEQFIKSNPDYRKALKYGVSSFKTMYLESIYYQCSQAAKKGEFKTAFKSALVLLSYPLKMPGLLYRLVLIKLKIIQP
jgi:glycosyltransferase involved in cell wall biosynthesis